MPSGYHLDIISGTPTAVTTSDNDGFGITMTPSGISGTDKFSLRTNPLNISTAFETAYELIARLQASNWDGWHYIQIKIYQPTNSSSYDLYQIMDATTYPYPPNGFETDKLLRTAPLLTNDTTNYVRIYLEIGIDGMAQGDGLINVKHFQLQKV